MTARWYGASLDPAEALLAAKYGPDFRTILGLKDHPYAETDDRAFYDFFGDVPFDAAPDLTAHARSVAGMMGVGL